MDNKKWPVLAQILIALALIGSLASVLRGLAQKDVIGVILGMVGLVVYWSVYKFKKWALVGLNILLSLTILLNLVSFFSNPQAMATIYFIGICFSVLVLLYFNSTKIKELFR